MEIKPLFLPSTQRGCHYRKRITSFFSRSTYKRNNSTYRGEIFRAFLSSMINRMTVFIRLVYTRIFMPIIFFLFHYTFFGSRRVFWLMRFLVDVTALVLSFSKPTIVDIEKEKKLGKIYHFCRARLPWRAFAEKLENVSWFFFLRKKENFVTISYFLTYILIENWQKTTALYRT